MEGDRANSETHTPAALLVEVINEANRIFAGRHNRLSPLTSEQERRQFIARCCAWWNHLLCPAMGRVGPYGTKNGSVTRSRKTTTHVLASMPEVPHSPHA